MKTKSYKQTEKYKKYNREYARRYRKEHPEYIKLCNIKYGRPYRLKHKEELKEYRKNYVLKHKKELKQGQAKYRKNNKIKISISKMRSQYKLTKDEATTLYNKKINGICNICLCPETNKRQILSVDHCHKTGKIRGLLCSKCNTALGAFKDSEQILKNAIKYLKRSING